MSFEIKKKEEYCDVCDSQAKAYFRRRSKNENTLGQRKEIIFCVKCANKMEVV